MVSVKDRTVHPCLVKKRRTGERGKGEREEGR